MKEKDRYGEKRVDEKKRKSSRMGFLSNDIKGMFLSKKCSCL